MEISFFIFLNLQGGRLYVSCIHRKEAGYQTAIPFGMRKSQNKEEEML